MNQQIIDYLSQHKDNFSQEDLVNQLRNSGYQDSDIEKGVGVVYGNQEGFYNKPSESFINKKVVVIGGAILTLLFIVGIIAFFFMEKDSAYESEESMGYIMEPMTDKLEKSRESKGTSREAVNFGEKSFYLDFEDKSPEGVIIKEYTQAGETVNNWNELFVVYDFPYDKNAMIYRDDLVNSLESKYSKDNVAKINGDKDGEYMVHFIVPDINYDEYNIFKYVDKNFGKVVISYQFAKKYDKSIAISLNNPNAEMKKWIDEMWVFYK